MKIAAFFSAENFLFHYAEEAAYDILLLDIEMGAMAPLGELLGTIGIFSGGLLVLNAGLGYVGANIPYGRIDVRSAVISQINHKACPLWQPCVQRVRVYLR